jgi:hypothetical protein
MIELPQGFEQKISTYKQAVVRQNTETAKAFLFLEFVRAVFGDINADHLETMVPQLEKFVKVRQGTVIVRGRIDALLGNMVIEFKRHLTEASIAESKEQLKKYLSVLLCEGTYLALASDGVRMHVFMPRARSRPGETLRAEDIVLDPIDEADLLTMNPRDAFLWLDRYLLSRELRSLTTESLSREVGIGSVFFGLAIEKLRKVWQKVRPRYHLLFREWADYLSVVYGARVETEELFLRHTYLATLAKLMAYMMYSGGAIPTTGQSHKILDGTAFKEWQIQNFLERDLFSWITQEDGGTSLILNLANQVSRYDLRKLDEDVLKGLYQELVDPQQRHDLGEYYTPDWLAEYTTARMLNGNPEKTVLDPACGSGTFLVEAIKYKKAKCKFTGQELLSHILESVVGADVHPLATIIAKTNYLIALGELLQTRTEPVYLPVYLADTIKLEAEEVEVEGARAFAKVIDEKRTLYVPAIDDEMRLDQALEITSSYALSLAEESSKLEEWFEMSLQRLQMNRTAISLFHMTSRTMAELIKERGDTIWAFVLSNFYKPMFMRNKFDIIMGNPPWLSYRFVENPEYKEFLKRLIKERYALTQKAELMTHMELASLFFLRSSELYLKERGEIGLVMTRGIFQADQHWAFREGSYKAINLGITAVVDLRYVEPLFKVPACLIFGKKGVSTKYPIDGQIGKGRLYKKNSSLRGAENEALKPLQFQNTKFNLYHVGERSYIAESTIPPISGGRSQYYSLFREGATLVPRQFWFVTMKPHPRLGMNLQVPYLETSSRAVERAKPDYLDVQLRGNVENVFLYSTLTSSEVVPFGHFALVPVVLPLQKDIKRYSLFTSAEARAREFTGLAHWLEQAEEIWRNKGGRKSVKDIYARLDRGRGLSSQNPLAKFRVIYAARQTKLAACIVDLKQPPQLNVGEVNIPLQGFVVDYGTFYYETDMEKEAHYLVSILNSGLVDKIIRPMLTTGQLGERNVCKKVLELPVCKYEFTNATHQRLAEISVLCAEKVKDILPEITHRYTSLGVIRNKVREALASELKQIDVLVLQLLSQS